MTLADAPDVLSPKQAQEILTLGEHSLCELLLVGKLRSVRAGRRILIPKTAIVAYLEGDTKKAR